MQGKDLRELAVVNIADGDHIGPVDEACLDLSAQHVVGFPITNGVGPCDGARDTGPIFAVSGVQTLGPDLVTLNDVTAVHVARIGGVHDVVVSLEARTGRDVVSERGTVGQIVSLRFHERTFAISDVEILPGILKSNTLTPSGQLGLLASEIVVVAKVAPDNQERAPAPV